MLKIHICSKYVDFFDISDSNNAWDIAKMFIKSVIIKHTIEKYSIFKNNEVDVCTRVCKSP